jgi:hypothetical protein
MCVRSYCSWELGGQSANPADRHSVCCRPQRMHLALLATSAPPYSPSPPENHARAQYPCTDAHTNERPPTPFLIKKCPTLTLCRILSISSDSSLVGRSARVRSSPDAVEVLSVGTSTAAALVCCGNAAHAMLLPLVSDRPAGAPLPLKALLLVLLPPRSAMHRPGRSCAAEIANGRWRFLANRASACLAHTLFSAPRTELLRIMLL